MSASRIDFAVRVRYTPTDEEVTITSHAARSVSAAHHNALRLLRARVWAVRAGIRPAVAIVASYDLPDDTPYPCDLIEYRTRAEGPETMNTEAEDEAQRGRSAGPPDPARRGRSAPERL